MGLLVFLAVGAVVVGGPLVWFLWRARLRSGATNMVLLGAAAGEAEKDLWIAALRSAAIRTHVSNVGDITAYGGSGPAPYSYEIWVPARDERRGVRGVGTVGPVGLNRTFTLVKVLFTELFTVIGETVSYVA